MESKLERRLGRSSKVRQLGTWLKRKALRLFI
jgi:hypothetical protein